MSEPPGGVGAALNAFLGWLLIVVGALIGGLGGLCTVAFARMDGFGAENYALLGVVPMGLGAAIVFSGVMVLRSRRRRWVPGPGDLARFSDWTPPAGGDVPDPNPEERADDR